MCASVEIISLKYSHRPEALLSETRTTQQGLEDTSSCILKHSVSWYFRGSHQLACVSSNPSSLKVHLFGSQEQIAKISTLCKSLVSPFLRGCHTGTVSMIWASWGYKDIKITIESQTRVHVLQSPAYLARSNVYEKKRGRKEYGKYSTMISQDNLSASSKEGIKLYFLL